jgi:hypothetical protein
MEQNRQQFVINNIHLLYDGLRFYNSKVLQYINVKKEILDFITMMKLYYNDDEINKLYNILINSKCLCGCGHYCDNEKAIIFLQNSFTYKNTHINSGYHYICRGDNIYVDMLGNIEITTDDCIVSISVNHYEFIYINDLFE